jgi:TatD DNase family protein
LKTIQEAPDPIAIGEIGLDYAQAKEKTERERQQIIFALQLDIAANRNLPVIIHSVRALEDTLRIMREHPIPAAIFHGFTGSPEEAARITGAGYYLSFGERSFRSNKTIEALGRTSTGRLFLETDESDVSIAEIYRKAAEILNITIGDLQKQIINNYQKIFK